MSVNAMKDESCAGSLDAKVPFSWEFDFSAVNPTLVEPNRMTEAIIDHHSYPFFQLMKNINVITGTSFKLVKNGVYHTVFMRFGMPGAIEGFKGIWIRGNLIICLQGDRFRMCFELEKVDTSVHSILLAVFSELKRMNGLLNPDDKMETAHENMSAIFDILTKGARNSNYVKEMSPFCGPEDTPEIGESDEEYIKRMGLNKLIFDCLDSATLLAFVVYVKKLFEKHGYALT